MRIISASALAAVMLAFVVTTESFESIRSLSIFGGRVAPARTTRLRCKRTVRYMVSSRLALSAHCRSSMPSRMGCSMARCSSNVATASSRRNFSWSGESISGSTVPAASPSILGSSGKRRVSVVIKGMPTNEIFSSFRLIICCSLASLVTRGAASPT